MLNACAINKVILMGRLTADPELRQTQSGISTCRFTVAVDGPNNQTTNERRTDFITVVAWRQTAEFVSRYFNKGKLILVEGNLRTGSYDDRNHPDVKHYTCEVVAENVSFGETKSSSQGGGMGGGYSNQQYGQQPAQQYAAPQQNAPAPAVSFGDLGDFEEVIGDGDLPF
ncbi:MAG: single-stranded DNA-binding protein [Oscillospiraceae bacterium]|nr:single-stranded DNA-binding protein [Oscillospiraceae bacterium]